MKLVKPSYEIYGGIDGPAIMKKLELAGRTAYKSEDKITEDSANKFIAGVIKKGHEAVIEHASITVRIICDRGVSHALVRHRLASYVQESTIYCNYSKDRFNKEVQFILPCWFEHTTEYYNTNIEANNFAAIPTNEIEWIKYNILAEELYMKLIASGWNTQMARSILPTAIKTEIVITMNLREWRHFFKLRTESVDHIQTLELTRPMLIDFQKALPVIFNDIELK